MNKQILSEYIDACELIKETEEDIKRLNKRKQMIIQANVKGSNPEFPYQEKHFKIKGSPFSYVDDSELQYQEKILEERKAKAEAIKRKVEEWMNMLPVRMQRIIRMRYFEKMAWEEIAKRMGRKATADSVRMEFKNFLK